MGIPVLYFRIRSINSIQFLLNSIQRKEDVLLTVVTWRWWAFSRADALRRESCLWWIEVSAEVPEVVGGLRLDPIPIQRHKLQVVRVPSIGSQRSPPIPTTQRQSSHAAGIAGLIFGTFQSFPMTRIGRRRLDGESITDFLKKKPG